MKFSLIFFLTVFPVIGSTARVVSNTSVRTNITNQIRLFTKRTPRINANAVSSNQAIYNTTQVKVKTTPVINNLTRIFLPTTLESTDVPTSVPAMSITPRPTTTTTTNTTPVNKSNITTTLVSLTSVKTTERPTITTTSTTNMSRTTAYTTQKSTALLKTAFHNISVNTTNTSTTVATKLPINTTYNINNINNTIATTTNTPTTTHITPTTPVYKTTIATPINATTQVDTTVMATPIVSKKSVHTTEMTTSMVSTTHINKTKMTTYTSPTTQVDTQRNTTPIDTTTQVDTTERTTPIVSRTKVDTTEMTTLTVSTTPIYTTETTTPFDSTTTVYTTGMTTTTDSRTPIHTTEIATPIDTRTPIATTEITTPISSTTPFDTTEITKHIDSTTHIYTTETTTPTASTTPVDTTENTTPTVTTTQVDTTEITTPTVSTTQVDTTEITTPIISTTQVDTTEITTPIISTTQVDTTEITTPNISTTQVDTTEITTPNISTTRVDTTEITTPNISTTQVDTTEITTPIISTTPVETTEITTPIVSATSIDTTEITTPMVSTTQGDTTEMPTPTVSTTPVDTTEITSSFVSTAPIDSTEITTPTVSTTPVNTTEITTPLVSATLVDTTEMTTPIISTTPIDTTEITTPTVLTTPMDTTEMTTSIVSTTPVDTTEIAPPTVSITPTETPEMTTGIVPTTALDTTEMDTPTVSTTLLDTTEITTPIVLTTLIDTTETTTHIVTTTPLDTIEMSTHIGSTTPTDTTEINTTFTFPVSEDTTLSSTTIDFTTIPVEENETLSSSIDFTTSSTTNRQVIKWNRHNIMLRILKPWSPNLLMEDSEEYSTLEKDIETNVNSSLGDTVSEMKVLEFRPGSVIAEISLNTSEDNALDVMKTNIQKGKIGNLPVDSSFPLQMGSPVKLSTTQKNYSKVQDGSLSVECTSDSKSDMKIMWMLKGLPILESKNTNARIQVKYAKDFNNVTAVGILTFKRLKLTDAGKLQCLAAGAVSSNRIGIALNVMPLPQVKITTKTPYVESGQNVTLNCLVVNNVSAVVTFHKINGIFQGNTTLYYNDGTTIRTTITLFSVTAETVILCRATNPLGKGETNTTLRVYKPQKKTCPEDDKWPTTPTGETAEIPCEVGFVGKIWRYCEDNGKWSAPNNEYCVAKEFEEIKDALADIKDNIGGNTSLVLDKLAKITNEKKETNITAGDMIVSIDALDKVVGITDEQKEIDKSQIEGFFAVASNIITPSREDKWSAIKKKDKKMGAKLLKKMEDFGSIVADKISNTSEAIVSKENLAVVVSKVSIEEKKSFPGKVKNLDKWVEKSKTTMELSSNLLKEVATGDQTSMPVSVVLFRNLSSILPNSNDDQSTNSTKSQAKLNTMVLSIKVGKQKINQLKNPVQLGFQHVKKEENLKGLCSYWDFDKKGTTGGGWSQEGCQVVRSNSSETQCHCYHLTNFAVLTTLVPQDSQALSIITLVGCCISIVCCLLTIILYISFWKYMTKSDLGRSKSVLIINMCVAVILAYTLLLAGMKSATVNKVVCTVVAAFLHLFCLSVFFSLFVYALDMVLTIFFVFKKTFNRLPLLLVLSWLCPAIIVAISLGITNTEGFGNKNFCWLSVENGVIWAFIGPIIFVIVINIIFLVYLFRTSMSSTTIKNKSNREKIKSGAQSLCLTTPIFGITWIIGVFAVHEDTISFQYIFAIINSLQGLFIFLTFCVFCKQFRQAVSGSYNRLIDLRTTTRTFRSKSRQTQSSQLKYSDATFENAAFDQRENSLPDYLQLDFMIPDEENDSAMFEFEAAPVQSNPRNRRYIDDKVKFSPTPLSPGPRYSNNRSSWDYENDFKEPINRGMSEMELASPWSVQNSDLPIRLPGNLQSSRFSLEFRWLQENT